MKLPKFFLKIFFISLPINIPNNAEYIVKARNKLISSICPKTKNPKLCSHLLHLSRKTYRASSPCSLGEGSLDMARFQAETSAGMMNTLLKTKRNLLDKENYEDCRDNYKLADKQILEAISKFRKDDFKSARKLLEVASKKAFGDRSPSEVRKINVTCDALFDVALVTVKVLEVKKKATNVIFQ